MELRTAAPPPAESASGEGVSVRRRAAKEGWGLAADPGAAELESADAESETGARRGELAGPPASDNAL